MAQIDELIDQPCDDPMTRPTSFDAPFEYLRFWAFFAIQPVLAVQHWRGTRGSAGIPPASSSAGCQRGRAF